jgi:tRNA uridine 5-carboxymethylaminomethyl modification enzyme
MGNKIGLADEERMQNVNKKRENTALLINDLKQKKVDPIRINSGLNAIDSATIKEKVSLEKLIRRPQVGIAELMEIDPEIADYFKKYEKDVLEQAEILIKYDSYIEKEQQMVKKISSMENYKIPIQFDYKTITALSAEGKQKLSKIKPETLGQASRISGVSPADLSIITVYLGR